MRLLILRLMVFAALGLGLAATSAAQVYTGRIDVTVTDTTGAVLPGVTVDLTGPQAVSATTDAKGEAHFLNLAPGTYTVAAKLTGFAEYTNRNVPVTAGGGVPLKIALAVGDVTQTVEVDGGVAGHRSATHGHHDQRHLRRAAADSVGARSLGRAADGSRRHRRPRQRRRRRVGPAVELPGQGRAQAARTPGTSTASRSPTWSALGSSPTYYDFDMFQEMNVTTGGADLQNRHARRRR